MTISRLKDRTVGGSIVADDDDADFDNIINELNGHTAATNPHTNSLDVTGDSMDGELTWGTNGFVNNSKVRTHTNYTGSEYFEYTYSATTADDTESTLATIALTDLYHYRIEGDVTCYDGSGTEYAAFFIKYSASRGGAGAVERMGNMIDKVVSTATLSSFFDVSGNNVRLRVIGKAATNLYWVATVKYQAVKTAA